MYILVLSVEDGRGRSQKLGASRSRKEMGLVVAGLHISMKPVAKYHKFPKSRPLKVAGIKPLFEFHEILRRQHGCSHESFYSLRHKTTQWPSHPTIHRKHKPLLT